jgi:aldose 1-epimerase
MHGTLQLRDEHWDVVVAPADGGSLLKCEFDALPVLLPVDQPSLVDRTSSKKQSCYFPLIPYSNRIEDSQFYFRDVPVKLARNVADSPHAMHGHGWLSRWLVTASSDTHCTLSYERAPDAEWPWRYLGRQTFAIRDDELTISLEVVNLAATPMPCGLGFHPYFPAAGGPRLRLHARSVWDGGVHAFPRQRVAVPERLDFSNGPSITERTGIDHCFEHWQGRASVTYPDSLLRVVLQSCPDADSVIVYVPSGGDFFCVEPVTHAVNAMNLSDPADAGFWTLEPDTARRITMSLQCVVVG